MAEYTSRFEDAKEDLGYTTEAEAEKINESVAKRENVLAKKEEKRKQIEENSLSYLLMKGIAKFDFILDPLIGLIPGVGDTISAFLGFPAVCVALFQVKSPALAIVVLRNIFIDWALGLIPVVGDVIDIFNMAHKRNAKLIVDYVNDEEVAEKVRQQAAISVFIIVALITGVVFAFKKLLAD